MPHQTINAYDLDCAEAGTGTPLVLVHGTLQDQRYWAPQMAAFGEYFHVVAPSLRHYWPKASSGNGTDFTIAQHTADIAALIGTLGAKACLVGHSRGGHIAFRVASEFPHLIRKLVLAEPGGELDESLGGKPPTGGQAANFARVAAKIAAGETEDGMRIFAEQIYGHGGWDKWSASRKQVALDNAVTLIGQVHENRLPYALAAAQAITAPTLLVRGNQTQPNFITICDGFARVMPHWRRAIIPNAAHGMSADNPETFNREVLNFSKRLKKRSFFFSKRTSPTYPAKGSRTRPDFIA